MSTVARSEIVLEEYRRAPQMVLVFPRSGQTWRLRLTPGLARRIAADIAPEPQAGALRFQKAGRRWRRRSQMVRRSWQRSLVG